MTRFHALALAAASSLLLALPAVAADLDPPATPASMHEQMMGQIKSLQNRPQQGQWTNPWMPAATGTTDRRESADSRLQAIVAGYDRATLDRGTWRNTVLPGDHYAAAEPLLATVVGSGVTTQGSGTAPLARLMALR